MVLATKLKNTKFITKFIAILLSIIFMFGAAYQFATIFAAASFYATAVGIFDSKELKNTKFTESKAFCFRLNNDLSELQYNVQYKNSAELKKYLATQKENFVNDILKKNKQINDKYNELKKRTEEMQDEEVEYGDYEYQLDEYPIAIDFNYEIVFNDVKYNIYSGNYDTIYNTEDEENVRKVAEKIFNEFAGKNYLTEEIISDSVERVNLKYYVKNNITGAVISNLAEGVKPKDVLKEKYSLSIIKGKINLSQELKNDNLVSHLDEYYDKDSDLDIYAYLDLDSGDKDHYTALITAHENLSQKNYRTIVKSGAVLTLASLILMIYALVVCGKHKENGKVKLAFIDYVPVSLHLTLTGLSIWGLIYAMIVITTENYYHSDLLYADNYYFLVTDLIRFICSLLAGVVWALFIEFVTSFARIVKSDRKFYKSTIVGLIVYALYKPVKKTFSRIKKLVEYNPNNFKRQLVLLLMGYGFANIIILVATFLFFAADVYVLGLLGLLLYFAMNIASLIFVTRYIMQLDEIISAANSRTTPKVNFEKLPSSLKTLVTSLHYTNKELNAAVNKAIKDERMRTELITNVSHDLKTPLTSIINYVDLLKKCDIQDEDAKEYIQILDEKGIKLKRLIEDLIEASKLTSGVVTVNPVQLNLGELATQAVVEHQSDFTDNGLNLIFKGDKQNVIAYADGNKTYRIIENLLSNAKKYSAKGSRVYADVYEANNACVFEIKNISSQQLDISAQELTERFVRGDKSRNQEGNGLGLSIAENLCKVQKGRLEIIIDGDLFKARVILPKA